MEPNPRNIPLLKNVLEQAPHRNLEYYKAKNNSVSRHIDDLLKVVLSDLVLTNQKEYAHDASSRAEDPLDIKYGLQKSFLPRISEYPTLEEYGEYVKSYKNISSQSFEGKMERMKPDVREKLLTRYNDETEKYVSLVDAIKAGGIPSLYVGDGGGAEAISTVDHEDVTLRLNIKVDAEDSVYGLIEKVVQEFMKDKDVMKYGFQIKTLSGDSDTRDGIIIYLPNNSFAPAGTIITNFFKDNVQYHDRHADPGIMFGVDLEADDGSKFPGIRVTEEPKAYSTFNTMQADIVSHAVIDYVQDFFAGDKDKMIESFKQDYDEALWRWEQEFPNYYEKSAKKLIGDNANLQNIAFLSTVEGK